MRVAPELPMARVQAAFKENRTRRDPLRGAVRPTNKEEADTMAAISGLRNTAESVSRLSYLSEYGLVLGAKLKAVLEAQIILLEWPGRFSCVPL